LAVTVTFEKKRKEEKKGLLSLTDSPNAFSGSLDIAMWTKRYLLSEDGIAPGISEKHSLI
jgi:hypothetical protein